jgi:hypothetical protein
MIEIHSLFEVDGKLIPVEEFTGPVRDEEYIDGTVEMIVNYKPVLSRQQVDLVDQLWGYLIRGLEEVIAGRAFSTGYPDMPVQVTMTPKGRMVHLHVDYKLGVREATVAIDELRAAMVPAARTFFELLKPHVQRHRDSCDRMLAKLAKLSPG